MALFKKKDTKLIEINKLLEEEVNPKLEQLKQDKQDLSMFKSNQNMIEEYTKITIAHEYWRAENAVRHSEPELNAIKAEIAKVQKQIGEKEEEVKGIK